MISMDSYERREIRRALDDIDRALNGFQGPFALREAEHRLLKLLRRNEE